MSVKRSHKTTPSYVLILSFINIFLTTATAAVQISDNRNSEKLDKTYSDPSLSKYIKPISFKEA